MTYRRIRSDFWDHPKTRGLSPLARDLFLQAVTSSPLGVSERSTKQLARRAGSNPADVSAALAELSERELVVWWDDLEILWVIEAADENLDNGKAKSAAIRVAECLPAEVQDRIAARYPWIREVPNSATEYPIPPGDRTEKRTGAGGERPPLPKITYHNAPDDVPILEALNGALCLSITADQHGRFYTSAAERVADGVPVEEIEGVLRAWVLDDKSKRRNRRTLFYAKHWEWVRKRYLDGPAAPEETAEEAHAVNHKPEPVRMDPARVSEIVSSLTRRVRK